MIYDRDAAFQQRMINLFWEHFTSTSLTYLSLAHASERTHAAGHKSGAGAHKHTRTLHAGRKRRGRVHVSAFVCHSCATSLRTSLP